MDSSSSSNAATAMHAFNLLYCNANYSDELMQKWGAEVGSDVPFFFSSGCAYVSGKGERVRSLGNPFINGDEEIARVDIFKPNQGLSTLSQSWYGCNIRTVEK